MRALRAGLAVLLASAGLLAAPSTGHAAAPPPGRITDPRLLAAIAAADAAAPAPTGRRVAASPLPELNVEILTSAPDTVARTVRRWGGTVTGAVPGALVQATVSPDAATALAAAPGVTDVRSPRRVGYVPVDTPALRRHLGEALPVGTGALGDEVISTNANKWQAAGITGAGVKIGIVDYFDFTLWNPAEHGVLPDAAHTFCRDSLAAQLCLGPNQIADDTGTGEHGVAVSEIVRDMAPGAELFVASVATVSDLRAAIAWFAGKGVTVMSRSLGAAYDGPGDGTGPLGAAVDYAASKGIVWFNSAGNDGEDAYLTRSVGATDGGGYVNFARPGQPVDTWLRVDSTDAASFYCFFLDGVRWAGDWNLPAAQRTDYRLEVWEPRPGFNPGSWTSAINPATFQVQPVNLNDPVVTGNQGGTGPGNNLIDASQRSGARPLEGADLAICPTNVANATNGTAVTYLRIRRNSATPIGAVPDRMEVGIAGSALLQFASSDRSGSAAKPVVDSKNPSLVAVGAVDPLAPLNPAVTDSIAFYSSQGPTTDGRIKPDMSAPSGMASTIYPQGFSGTSSSSPTAAGAAALVLSAHLAVRGAPLAALVRHFTVDRGARGPDNAYGTGVLRLPAPPVVPAATTPGQYVALTAPTRVLDSRPGGVGAQRGPFAKGTIIDLTLLGGAVPTTGVSAVAVNLTTTDSQAAGYLQAYPYMTGATGATTTLTIARPRAVQANFTVIPLGNRGLASLYLPSGGNVIVDVLGYFTANQPVVTRGRFVPLTSPERWMDTRRTGLLPSTFHGVARRMRAGETVDLPVLHPTTIGAAFPSQVSALVVNLTATTAAGPGFVRAARKGTNLGALQHSNLNFVAGSSSANMAIVPVDANGRISLYAGTAVDLIVDVVGYFTSAAAPLSSAGAFMPVVPRHVYSAQFAAGQTRSAALTGGATGLPAGVAGVSANLTVLSPASSGYLTVYPGTVRPRTSNVNVAAGRPAANGALLRVNPGTTANTVTGFMSTAGHVIIDVNGYFVAAPS